MGDFSALKKAVEVLRRREKGAQAMLGDAVASG